MASFSKQFILSLIYLCTDAYFFSCIFVVIGRNSNSNFSLKQARIYTNLSQKKEGQKCMAKNIHFIATKKSLYKDKFKMKPQKRSNF